MCRALGSRGGAYFKDNFKAKTNTEGKVLHCSLSAHERYFIDNLFKDKCKFLETGSLCVKIHRTFPTAFEGRRSRGRAKISTFRCCLGNQILNKILRRKKKKKPLLTTYHPMLPKLQCIHKISTIWLCM